MFTIEMLPAGVGDALWIEYGDPAHPHRILVDGGLRSTLPALLAKLQSLPDDGRIELAVLTHVDNDHVNGLLALMQREDVDLRIDDFWMNGWEHVAPPDALGTFEAEQLSRLIQSKGYHWNAAFRRAAIAVPDQGDLPAVALPGGMRITVLSPDQNRLRALAPAWEEAIRRLGADEDEGEGEGEEQAPATPPDALGEELDVEKLAAEAFQEDDAIPNGGSIVLLCEYGGKSLLLAGDAHPSLITESLDRLAKQRGHLRLKLDAFKVSHHGSKANTSPELLTRIKCPAFLFSSKGTRRQQHPDKPTIARILAADPVNPKRLIFNYHSPYNSVWDDNSLKAAYLYETVYPSSGEGGVVFEV